ncbi:MAG: hypothetical protein JXA69_19265 [Phycisphaerae bacterium]|nr:hypothetical protein [Phycisphaerae bacterium]
MKQRDTRAFTLMHVIATIALAGLVTTAATLTITRCLRVQHRVSTWTNDDAATQGILQRLRQDVGQARTAEIATDPANALILRGPDLEVRYAATDHLVERTEQQIGKAPIRHTWRLERTSLQWTIERAGDEALVWMRVEMVDPITRKAPMTHRYAVGLRCGGAGTQEQEP